MYTDLRDLLALLTIVIKILMEQTSTEVVFLMR